MWRNDSPRSNASVPKRNPSLLRNIFALQPFKTWQLVACESGLTFGVMARIALSAIHSLSKRQASTEVRNEMRNAMRPHSGQRRIQPARSQSAHLLERSSCYHFIEASIYPRIKLWARRRDKERGRRWVEQGRCAKELKLSQRASGCFKYFKSTQNALWIGLAQTLRGFRITSLKLSVKFLRRASLSLRAHFFTHCTRHFGNLGQALQRRLEVKPGPSRHYCEPSLFRQFTKRRAQIREPAAH